MLTVSRVTLFLLRSFACVAFVSSVVSCAAWTTTRTAEMLPYVATAEHTSTTGELSSEHKSVERCHSHFLGIRFANEARPDEVVLDLGYGAAYVKDVTVYRDVRYPFFVRIYEEECWIAEGMVFSDGGKQ